jgi:tetratricopeptide (TPR) repeat protein
MERETFLGFKTYKALAYRLSDLGIVDKSIEWAEKARENYEKQEDFLGAAELKIFIAGQYRDQGEVYEAGKNYTYAESLLYQYNSKKEATCESQLITWKIKYGKIMVKDELEEADYRQAVTKYSGLHEEVKTYLKKIRVSDVSDKRKIKSYKNDTLRLSAEMKRLCGEYEEALNIFNSVYKKYDYFYGKEKVYSVLGQGDCLRMLEEQFDEAEKKYNDVKMFAEEKKDKRLEARVLRSIIELYRYRMTRVKIKKSLEDLKVIIKKSLEDLKKVSDETKYFGSKFYYHLLGGAMALMDDRDRDKAENFFKDAIFYLAKKSKTECSFEEALLLAKKIKPEYSHSIFGLAEVKRLKNNLDDAQKYYKEANTLYRGIGISWGIIRTIIGNAMVNPSDSDITKSLKEGYRVLINKSDIRLINKFRRGKLNSAEILFLNIP